MEAVTRALRVMLEDPKVYHKQAPEAGEGSSSWSPELKPLSMVWPNLDKRNFHDCFEGRSWVVTLVKALEDS